MARTKVVNVTSRSISDYIPNRLSGLHENGVPDYRNSRRVIEKRDHVGQRISVNGGGAKDIYASNIQVADLNALMSYSRS